MYDSPCSFPVSLLINVQDDKKLEALQIARTLKEGHPGPQAYQGLADTLNPPSIVTAKQIYDWVSTVTQKEPQAKLMVSGLRIRIKKWEAEDSKCWREFVGLDPLLITLSCVVALFNILRTIKESLPDVFEMGIPNKTRAQRRTDLLNAWSAKVVEKSGLLGATWVQNWKSFSRFLEKHYQRLDMKCPQNDIKRCVSCITPSYSYNKMLTQLKALLKKRLPQHLTCRLGLFQPPRIYQLTQVQTTRTASTVFAAAGVLPVLMLGSYI